MRGDERRRHRRARAELSVSLAFASVHEFLSACALDVSESGMFIRGFTEDARGNPVEVGQPVTLRFDAGDERIVEGTARVARVGAGGIGIEFVDLDAAGRKLIEMIVEIQLAAG